MPPLVALINVSHVGYPALVALLIAESAGLPLPGETALITAGILASQHKLSIELVIVFAAAGSLIGGNVGFLIGRKGGRYLLERPGRFASQRAEVLRFGDPFFERHGSKAVFFSRFIVGLRTWAAWLAGASDMRYWRFFVWNAVGAIGWATLIGLLAYFVGHSVESAISSSGLYALLVVALAVVAAVLAHRRLRKRRRAPRR